MKTIAFHSYKGGTGKTLTAANLAVCLSRLGKHCVLLDMDFDGPSLHFKIPGSEDEAAKGGFMKYVFSHAQGECWPKNVPFPVVFDELEHMSDLKRYCSEEPLSAKGRQGKIHIIPAGNMFYESYRDNVASPKCRRILNIHKEYEQGRMGVEDFEKGIEYLDNIKLQIEGLKPNPEYLLLDLRSGYHQFASTIITCWVDTLVHMFMFNGVSIRAASKLFTDFAMDIEVVPVLCRVPTNIDYRGDRDLQNVLDKLGMSIDTLPVLYSDRDLEMAERLRLGFDRDPKNVLLSHNYVELFKKLIDSSDIPEEGLSAAIGLEVNLHEQDRIFRIEKDRGALINPDDNARNVSFKVKTFQLLLAGLEDGLSGIVEAGKGETRASSADKKENGNKRADEKKTREWFETCLHSAGMKCGKKFGEALQEFWDRKKFKKKKKVDFILQYKLQKWFDFDSDVGFGRFQLAPDIETRTQGDKLLKAEIILRESFLTSGKKTELQEKDKHLYCKLMMGYIEGVLNQIVENAVTVGHGEMDHDRHKNLFGNVEPRSESCVFPITDKNTKEKNGA